MRKLLIYLIAFALSFSGEVVLAQSQSEPIHTHSENNGMSVDYYYYPDKNQTMVVTNSPCWSCGGLGVCSFCRGAGGIWMSFGYVPCTICGGGKGVCPTCNGRGTYSTTSIINGNTNYGSIVGSDGNSWSGYVSQNSSSVSGSSSGDSSSSRSSSSKSKNYIVVKKYAPNYTGSSEKVWCEECKCMDYPHAHVKEFY